MKHLAAIMSLAFLIILTPSGLFCQNFRPMFKDYKALIFSPFAGGYIFEDNQTYPEHAVDLNYELTDRYSLGLRMGYEMSRYFDIEATINFVPTSHNVGNVHLYLYHADLLYNIVNYGRITPYIDFGVGGVTFSPVFGGRKTSPLITYSAGLKIFIIESLAFRIDIRGYTKFNGTFTNLNFTGGLAYFAGLGRNKDTDKDGYADEFDLCPKVPEDFEGYLDEDGCPETRGAQDPLKGYCEDKK